MAQSAVTIIIDDREFREALRQIIATDTKGFAYVCNDQAIRLCQQAMANTRQATKGSISKLARLAYTGSDPRSINRKKKTAKGQYTPGTFAWMQGVRKRRRGKAFGWNEPGKVDYVTRLIAERDSARGYLKAGWIPAIREFSMANGHGPMGRRQRGAQMYGKGHGIGKAAKPGINPTAIAINSIKDEGKLSYNPGHASALTEAALRAAVPQRVADMKRKLEERMNRDHAKFISQVGGRIFR